MDPDIDVCKLCSSIGCSFYFTADQSVPWDSILLDREGQDTSITIGVRCARSTLYIYCMYSRILLLSFMHNCKIDFDY